MENTKRLLLLQFTNAYLKHTHYKLTFLSPANNFPQLELLSVLLLISRPLTAQYILL